MNTQMLLATIIALVVGAVMVPVYDFIQHTALPDLQKLPRWLTRVALGVLNLALNYVATLPTVHLDCSPSCSVDQLTQAHLTVLLTSALSVASMFFFKHANTTAALAKQVTEPAHDPGA